MDCCKAPTTSNISSEIPHSCDHFCSAVESGPCCKKGTGVTAVAEEVASVGAAKNDDIDQALDCTLDFYQMQMYVQSCISVLSCVGYFSSLLQLCPSAPLAHCSGTGRRARLMAPKQLKQATWWLLLPWECSVVVLLA